jgi:hypothetical protein
MLKTSTPIFEEASTLETASTLPVTRRQLLRTMAVGSVALVGGAALASCGGSSSTTSAINVTFYTNGWPGDSMPTAAQQKQLPATKAYADSLAAWLKQNPGVQVKHTATSVWDQQTIITAISAGTAPTWYEGNVLGSFLNPAVKAALTRGLAADLTDLVTKNNLEAQLTDTYLPVFRSWKVNGRYYGTPGGYGVGNCVFYRRDLLQQYGLQEPSLGWTWHDFRVLAKQLTRGKMHGSQAVNYLFSENLVANGLVSSVISMGSLGIVPSPSSSYPWRLDVASFLNQYEAVINDWRAMIYEDKSVLSNTTYGDSDVSAAFIRGDVAMISTNNNFVTSAPSSTNPTAAQTLTNRLNKPIEDVIGMIPNPNGLNGSFGATQAGSAIGSVDPKFQRNPAALAKAYDFLIYMLIGQGAIDQIQELYRTTKDLKLVYSNTPPMTKNMESFSGIPGTATDAWGAKTMQSIQAAANIPLVPDYTQYFPPEQNTLPTEDLNNDALNGLNFTQNPIGPIISKWQTTQNQQLASLTSSVSKSDFLTAAKKFYADVDAFWAKNAPNFSAQEFHPWYEQTILPALGS